MLAPTSKTSISGSTKRSSHDSPSMVAFRQVVVFA